MRFKNPRLLIIPGLRDSESCHWQSWLQRQYRDARRVVQDDFHTPDLGKWAARIQETLDTEPEGQRWTAVAHSFGCLALARHLADVPGSPIDRVLLVAPAEPRKFGLADLLPQGELGVSSTMIASDNDPWMSAQSALGWAHRWGSRYINLGAVGHINSASGFGPFPLAHRWVEASRTRALRERRSLSAPLPDEVCCQPAQRHCRITHRSHSLAASAAA